MKSGLYWVLGLIACLFAVLAVLSDAEHKEGETYILSNEFRQLTFGTENVNGHYFFLDKNGNLYKRSERDDTSELISRLNPSVSNQIFEQSEIIKRFEQPASISPSPRFIELRDSDGTFKVSWAGAARAPDENLQMFYRVLLRLANTQNS